MKCCICWNSEVCTKCILILCYSMRPWEPSHTGQRTTLPWKIFGVCFTTKYYFSFLHQNCTFNLVCHLPFFFFFFLKVTSHLKKKKEICLWLGMCSYIKSQDGFHQIQFIICKRENLAKIDHPADLACALEKWSICPPPCTLTLCLLPKAPQSCSIY